MAASYVIFSKDMGARIILGIPVGGTSDVAARAIAVPMSKTLGEVGVPDFEVSFNVGLWSTPKAPRDAINAVSAAAAAAAKLSDVMALFRKLGGDAVGSTPEEQLKTIDGELRFWVEAARIAKFVPQ